MYNRKPDGLYFCKKSNRVVEHDRYAVRIHWSQDMLDYLKRNFATTLNDELAGCIGVSLRTMIRKARELGLYKDREWLAGIWKERRLLAHCISKKKGYPGRFKKGVRVNPKDEFKKGEKRSLEFIRKQSESMKRWYRLHPLEASRKAKKGWETRRRYMNDKSKKL